MDKFTTLTATAAPLLTPNIDTDVLIRVERMIDLVRGEFGPYCFEAWRYRPDGRDNPDFVLNHPGYSGVKILIAGANFGCGSSREPAVWSLWDMGFRCVIAPSFGDIFFNNCLQNGMLPVILPAETVDALAHEATPGAAQFTVDLLTQRIRAPSSLEVAFDIEPSRRQALIDGQDEITASLAREPEIAAFQARDRALRPWNYDIFG